MKKSITISKLMVAARSAVNDYLYKQDFRRISRSFLKEVAAHLGLTKGQFEIEFNEGGQAVSGDGSLYSDSFYLTIGEMGVMWRTVKGRKDYTGGPNQWFYFQEAGLDLTAEEVAGTIKGVLQRAAETV